MGVFKDYEKAVWNVEHNNCTLGELEAAEQRLKDGIIDWHPYLQEKPVINKKYLVTRNGNIEISNWYNGMFSFGIVTAWAELPKPYEGSEEE